MTNAEYCARYYRRGGKAKIKAKTAEYVARNRAHVNSIKAQPCTDCGGSFPPCAMQFDHVRGVKRKEVSIMVTNANSIASIDAEIAKCDLVCANCHCIRTESRRLIIAV